MDPVNRIGAKAFFMDGSGKKKTSKEEDLAKALREAVDNLYRAQDDMMERHQETVKQGLEKNKEIWKERSHREVLEKAAENRERYFEARSTEAREREKEMNALFVKGRSQSSEEEALKLEKRALNEDNPSLALAAKEDRRKAAGEKVEAERAVQQARRLKEQKWVL
ncbi:MAG TPA: hypothetical protein PK364_05095 [Synergistaceae bacterium]|nr:hypothetical protein [Synergistaceae bacterium]HPJ25446.1 hypothetical protein [Synergistaceae bacterium]HPQ36709.1 hypothetical protein [Synergistaceae bacterium]